MKSTWPYLPTKFDFDETNLSCLNIKIIIGYISQTRQELQKVLSPPSNNWLNIFSFVLFLPPLNCCSLRHICTFPFISTISTLLSSLVNLPGLLQQPSNWSPNLHLIPFPLLSFRFIFLRVFLTRLLCYSQVFNDLHHLQTSSYLLSVHSFFQPYGIPFPYRGLCSSIPPSFPIPLPVLKLLPTSRISVV